MLKQRAHKAPPAHAQDRTGDASRTTRGRGLEAAVRAMRGWRRYPAAGFAGALATFALAPLHLWPVMFAALSVLVWLMDGNAEQMRTLGARVRASAILGWWFGFGYFFASLYWIGFAFFVQAEQFAWLSPLGVLGMPVGLALFFALALALAGLVWRPGPARILTLALAFMVAEWLRGHVLTGFPWNALGYTLAAPDTLMQAGALVGVYGLSFFALLIFAAPATLTDASPRALRYLMPALAVILLAGMSAWGTWRLSQPLPPDADGPRLRIVQANIPQAEKWNPDAQDWIFARYLNLSRGDAPPGAEEITHIIWPEAALPFVYLFDDQIAKESQQTAFDRLLQPGVMLLTGANRAETTTRDDGERVVSAVFNSMLALDDRGAVTARSDKAHLVPFGEYLPFQETLEALGIRQLTNLPGGFAAGAHLNTLELPGLPPVTPLICYEIIFPGAVTPAARPAWFLNLTDDSWFGETAGPYQHLHQARLRAVEEGLPVIRAANTGISAVIGPRGELRETLALGETGTIDTALPAALSAPLHARMGTAIPFIILIAGALVALVLHRITPQGRRS